MLFQALEKKNKELKQNEEKVRAANLELCTKMREMIQELDQEKQEAAQRYSAFSIYNYFVTLAVFTFKTCAFRAERIHQQHRDDVVNNIRTELMLEHSAQIEQLTEQHQQQLQQLQWVSSLFTDVVVMLKNCILFIVHLLSFTELSCLRLMIEC